MYVRAVVVAMGLTTKLLNEVLCSLSDAMYEYGLRYLIGSGPSKGIKLLKDAAGLGHAQAQYMLACMYVTPSPSVSLCFQ